MKKNIPLLKCLALASACVMTLLVSGCLQEGVVRSHAPQASFDLSNITFDENTLPVVILGGGVAGLTAANYCAQAGIPCLVVEGEKPGGALAQSDSVRNWPGVINLPGSEIVSMMKDQVFENGVSIVREKAVELQTAQWPYQLELQDIETGKKRMVKTLSCIVASGAEPNYLNVAGERGQAGYWGRGVTNCAVCDGSLYRGKRVAVVGGGDSAVVEANYLAGIAREVLVFVRKDFFRANDKRKRDALEARSNVKILFNSEISEIVGDGAHVKQVKIKDTKSASEQLIDMDGVFLAIGARPNTGWLNGQLALDGEGYIRVTHGQLTSVPGIFAAGDICDPFYKQAVTSASGGCIAALQVQKFLEEIGYDAHKSVKQESVKVADEPQQEVKAAPVVNEEISQGVIEITSTEHFSTLLANTDKPMFIDLYANLCLACKQMEPVFKELVHLFEQKIVFVKINLSNSEIDPAQITQLIGGKEIASVPTFLLINKKKEVERFEGVVARAVLEERLVRVFYI